MDQPPVFRRSWLKGGGLILVGVVAAAYCWVTVVVPHLQPAFESVDALDANRVRSLTVFVLNRPDRDPETFEFPFEGNGYQFEAAEVQRCLLAGDLESPLVPHATTMEVMGLLDTIREEIGVFY